jgi:hypothetical protein
MCPDYTLVEESVMPEFLEQLKLVSTYSLSSQVIYIGVRLPSVPTANLLPLQTVEKTYGSDPSARMARIVNSRPFGHPTSLLASTKGKLVLSGLPDASKLFIPPAVVTDLKLADPLLASETFGPILSVLS